MSLRGQSNPRSRHNINIAELLRMHSPSLCLSTRSLHLDYFRLHCPRSATPFILTVLVVLSSRNPSVLIRFLSSYDYPYLPTLLCEYSVPPSTPESWSSFHPRTQAICLESLTISPSASSSQTRNMAASLSNHRKTRSPAGSPRSPFQRPSWPTGLISSLAQSPGSSTGSPTRVASGTRHWASSA